jgi:acyl-CoA synthetase (AMP-forming)/AMP-acid ligase II
MTDPDLQIPNQSEFYNAADDLLQRSINAGRGEGTAIVGDDGSHTYNQLVDRVNRCANVLRQLGLRAGQRILLCLVNSSDFHTSFLGVIKAGVVPVPLNTLWTSSDFAYAMSDSGAAAVILQSPASAGSRKREKSMAKAAGKATKKNSAFMKPMQPSEQLAKIVGAEPLPRSEVTKKIWAHIKKHKLQNPQNKREILADDKLQPIFGGKKLDMFQMTKAVNKHLK